MDLLSGLRDAERQAGAVFDTGGDPAAPRHFGDPRAEYNAARTAAAVFDLTDRAQIEITGRDRAKFLHNFCTNDIRGLPPGRRCEAFLTNVQGKVLAHVAVFAGEQALDLECVPESAARIIAHLSKYQITEDVAFNDRTAVRGELFVSGPEAGAVLGRIGFDLSGLELWQHASAQVGGMQVQVRRTDLLAAPGFALVADRGQMAELFRAIASAGARPAGTAAFEALRIEAAVPIYGQDITEANLAQEVHRTKRAISFTKGCYLGQEPIARIDAMGHVNQELFGLRLAGGPVPPPGTEVLAAGADEKVVGRITSSALSFSNDLPVALAYIRRPLNAAGTEVRVRDGDGFTSGVLFWPEA